MNFSFLDVLADEYVEGALPFAEYSGKDSEENQEFCAKYIAPLLEKDKNFGEEVEGDYEAAVCTEKYQSFQDGFKACIQMLLECASDKAVKS